MPKQCAACGAQNFTSDMACDQCGGADFSPPQWSPPDPNSWTAKTKAALENALGGLFWIGAGAAGLWWIGFTFFYAPRNVDPSGSPSTPRPIPGVSRTSPVIAVQLALMTHVPAAEPRLELLQGNNLDVYATRAAFEQVPFPDRRKMMKQAGKAWCDRVEHTYMPAVRLRDIRNGDIFASFSCVLGWASVDGS